MSDSRPSELDREVLTAALEALPDGVAVFDADWTITYVNPAGGVLLGRSAAELIGRSIWVTVPELAGTIFHGFLMHARTAGTPVTWAGYYAPTERWLSATAAVVAGRLQVSFRETGGRFPERPAETGPAPAPETDEAVDLDRLRFLAEVSESLISTLDRGETVTRLAELLVPRLCDFAIVSMIGDDSGPANEGRAHRDPAGRVDLDIYLDGVARNEDEDSPLTAALMMGAPVQLERLDPAMVEPSLTTEAVRAAWERLGATSCAIVPLRARGETFGAMLMLNCGNRPPLNEMELAVAVEVARRGGLSLDNGRLYERQLKVAETLQRSLLTPPPDLEDVQIAVRYRPATSYQQVGGDWYDAFPQPDGATVLVIGDVVGHDIGAAAAMGQVRSILRGIASDRAGRPAETLARVDRVLGTLRVGTLATALVARLECPDPAAAPEGSRTLRWSSAGHLPPLLLHPDGSVEVLATPAERLLGTSAAGPRTDHTVPLGAGATVVFTTDGLVEHGRTGIDEGLGRLAGALADLAPLPLEELCDALLERIVRGRTDDDIAVLALRCHVPS